MLRDKLRAYANQMRSEAVEIIDILNDLDDESRKEGEQAELTTARTRRLMMHFARALRMATCGSQDLMASFEVQSLYVPSSMVGGSVEINQKGFECGHCGARFGSEKSLDYHRESIHGLFKKVLPQPDPSDRPGTSVKMKCARCEKIFDTPNEFARHSHNPLIQCQECGEETFPEVEHKCIKVRCYACGEEVIVRTMSLHNCVNKNRVNLKRCLQCRGYYYPEYSDEYTMGTPCPYPHL